MNEIKLGEWQIRTQPQLDAGYYYHPDLCAYVVQPELFEQLKQRQVSVEPEVKLNFVDFEKTATPFYKEIRGIVHYPNTNASPEVKDRLCVLVKKIFDENWKWFNSKISA